MYKGGIKIEGIKEILMMEFKQELGRELTENEKDFIQWMASQHKLELQKKF